MIDSWGIVVTNVLVRKMEQGVKTIA